MFVTENITRINLQPNTSDFMNKLLLKIVCSELQHHISNVKKRSSESSVYYNRKRMWLTLM